ncbi:MULTISPECIES: carboxymuconolactone decarboxylase family protein [unclassified Thermoactinomyces]|uniref:carboxymuconolactone decarboxylase family protein n=1 Tax=unclassified Thermoactinomyces TaxID=2634588 RepID=UPI0018DB0C01|nr:MULTISPECIES: carboxymuconolactone decarboxylase family protein [unclassified Thermoactinomyces]MBH8597194.1 carboxymuconolactone decarboxylase family protein [Thermoactinomyces sp. CICC 10523]MBH8602754.1 carboxymuconolactone decarboxylase family protein [Thermoactinomyces sp. CICC 10522]
MDAQSTFQHDSVQQHLIHYKEGLGKFAGKMPDLVRAYNEFTSHCFQEGEIPLKYKHLIALAISLHAQDEYCMVYHSKGCIDQGCTEKEILEAVGVAAAIGGGAVMSQGVTLLQKCLNEFNQGVH